MIIAAKTYTSRSMLALAVLFSLAMTDRAIAGLVVAPIFNPNTGMYLAVESAGTWAEAQAQAVGLGGNLATVVSAADNQFIVNNLLQDFTGVGGPNLTNLPLWIGLYDPTGAANDDGGPNHAANFVWVDGSSSAYRNWHPGEPNDDDLGIHEYYAAINWQHAVDSGLQVGTWNDTPLNGTTGIGGANAYGPYYGIVELASVPEPSSLTLVIIGLGAAAIMLRKRMRTAAEFARA